MLEAPSLTSMRTEALTLVLFMLAGLALFAPILGSFFLSDDFILVELVRNGGPLSVWWRGAGFFRPLISLSLYADHSISGLRPLGYHLTNVLAHSGCAFLVYRIALALGLGRLTAGLCGVIFLALPSHSEPVAWIAGRTDVLAALFGLAALDSYLRFRRQGRPSALAVAVALFFVGLGAKESVVTLFAIAFFADLLLTVPAARPAPRRHRLVATGVLVTAGGVYLLVRRAMIGQWVGGYGAAVHLKPDLLQVVANLVLFPLRALGSQVPAALLPRSLPSTGVQQALLHGLRARLPEWALVALATAALAGAAALGMGAVRSARRRLTRAQVLTLGFCVIAFYVALLPVLNLSVSLLSTEGERFLYFPSAFAVLAAVALLRFWLRTKWAQRAVFTLVLLFYVVALGYANHNWQTAAELTEQLVAQLRAEPGESPLLLLNLPDSIGGAFVLRNGLAAALRLFDQTPRAVFVLTVHTLLDSDDEVAVTAAAPARSTTALTIQLAEPRAHFYSITTPPPGSRLGGSYEVATPDRGRCMLRWSGVRPPYALRYYSGGVLHPLVLAGSSP